MNQSRFLRSIASLGISTALLLITGNGAWGFGNKDVAVKVAELPERYHAVIVHGVDFSPDTKSIAIESDHDNINIWDWRNARIDKTVTKPAGFNVGSTSYPVKFSADGLWLAICESPGENGTVVRIWDARTWNVSKDISDVGPVTAAAISFTADGKFLLRGADRGGSPGDTLMVHAASTWQIAWSLHMANFGTQTIAVSTDGMYAAIGGSEMVVPANVTDRLQRMQQTTFASTINIVDLRNHSVVQVIQAEARGPIAWSPDGARIALAGQLYAEMFDSQTGKRLVHDKIEKSGTMNVQFTPDGRYFIESDLNGMGRGLGVKIWDNTRHKLLQEIPGDIGGIAVSRDGKYLAVGTTGRTTIWQFKGAELSQ